MAGQGLCTEAVTALVDFARQELGAMRLEICSDPRNLRSRGVAERCGFVLEGILRRNMRDPYGGLRDSCMYALVIE
jgi:RimJ/RimL family protein N-acetyltransferase